MATVFLLRNLAHKLGAALAHLQASNIAYDKGEANP